MSEFYAFASENPFLTFFLGVLVLVAWSGPWAVLRRVIRSIDIQTNGWPTAPLMDADGDIIHPPKD